MCEDSCASGIPSVSRLVVRAMQMCRTVACRCLHSLYPVCVDMGASGMIV